MKTIEILSIFSLFPSFFLWFFHFAKNFGGASSPPSPHPPPPTRGYAPGPRPSSLIKSETYQCDFDVRLWIEFYSGSKRILCSYIEFQIKVSIQIDPNYKQANKLKTCLRYCLFINVESSFRKILDSKINNFIRAAVLHFKNYTEKMYISNL